MTINDKKTFVAKYRAALNVKLSREEFASYLGVLPDSVTRRRLSIYTSTGLDLEHLQSDPNFDSNQGIEVSKLEKFESEFIRILERDAGPQSIDLSIDQSPKCMLLLLLKIQHLFMKVSYLHLLNIAIAEMHD